MKNNESSKYFPADLPDSSSSCCSDRATSRFCPSYPLHMNGRPFASRADDGELRFQDEMTEKSLRHPESIRFFGPCVTVRCVHWSDHCGLGAELSRTVSVSINSRLPDVNASNPCPIQSSCRWRAENGENVCSACLSVDYLMSDK